MQNPQMIPKALPSAERYRTLLEINNAIITNLTQESLFDAICEALQHVLPVYRAALTLYDPDTRHDTHPRAFDAIGIRIIFGSESR